MNSKVIESRFKLYDLCHISHLNVKKFNKNFDNIYNLSTLSANFLIFQFIFSILFTQKEFSEDSLFQ